MSAKQGQSRSESTQPGEFERSLIYNAIAQLRPDSWHEVAALIKSGEDVHMRGTYKETYLHVLAAPRPEDAVPYVEAIAYVLSEAGIEVNAKDQEGNTALHICTLNDIHHSLARTFVRIGVDPCLLNGEDQDALDLAYNDRMKEQLEYFEPGLWRAVSNGEVEKVQQLLKAWCKIGLKEGNKKLIKVAEDSDKKTIAKCLKKDKDTIKLVHTALSGNADALKEILKKGAVDPKTKDASYLLDKGGRIEWPLLAETIRLGLFESAMVLLTSSESVNTELEPEPEVKIPIYLWAMDHVQLAEDSFKIALFQNADLKYVANQLDLMYRLWRKCFPNEVLELLVEKGWSLSQRDDNGYSLRDLIFLDCFDLTRDRLVQNLMFVDQVVLSMARKGQTKQLEKLAIDGYEYINVYDQHGKSALQLAKEAKHRDTVSFLKKLPKLQRDAFQLHRYIEVANLQQARDLMDNHMIRARDRAGRSALHKAILFEKTYISKHILENYPDVVNLKDSYGRTALHYACSVQEGEDLEELLIKHGADEAAHDQHGSTPMDYKLQASSDFIEGERLKEYGGEVYLLERYLTLAGAIEDGDLDRLKVTTESLFQYNLNDFAYRLEEGQVSRLQYRPLLFLCLDQERSDMAKYLMEMGADARVAGVVYTETGEVQLVPLIDYAAMKDDYDLVEFIKTLLEKYDEDPMSVPPYPMTASRHGSGLSSLSSRATCLSNYQYADTADEAIMPSGGGQAWDKQPTGKQKKAQTSSACVIL